MGRPVASTGQAVGRHLPEGTEPCPSRSVGGCLLEETVVLVTRHGMGNTDPELQRKLFAT